MDALKLIAQDSIKAEKPAIEVGNTFTMAEDRQLRCLSAMNTVWLNRTIQFRPIQML